MERGWLYEWAWDHFGDQLDALYGLRATAHQRLREWACFWLDHKMHQGPPGPWSWDGEWEVSCDRCESEGPNERAADAGHINTLPQRFLRVVCAVLERFGYYRRIDAKLNGLAEPSRSDAPQVSSSSHSQEGKATT